MVYKILCQAHLKEVSLTQDRKTMTIQNLIIIGPWNTVVMK